MTSAHRNRARSGAGVARSGKAWIGMRNGPCDAAFHHRCGARNRRARAVATPSTRGVQDAIVERPPEAGSAAYVIDGDTRGGDRAELPRLQDAIKATARRSGGAITASTTWTFEGFTRTWACDRPRLLQAHNAGVQRSSAGGNPCNELLSPVAAHGSSDRLRTAAGRTVEALADKPVGTVGMAATRVDTHIGTWRGASHPPGQHHPATSPI